MRKMKPKRVHGVDWIDSYSLKIESPLVEEALIHLINLSINQSLFSTRWKPQLIFPLHKKDEKDVIKNYRPVSHLVQVGKMVCSMQHISKLLTISPPSAYSTQTTMAP